MGLFDNVANRVKSDLEYKAGNKIVSGIEGLASKKPSAPPGTKCPKCGKPITPGTKFCANCGAALTVSCATCKKEYPVGTKFCTQCGQALK
jgi:predicted amidophosphoribosyltransferase